MRLRLVAVSLAVTSMVALAFLVPLMILTRDLARDRALAEIEQRAETAALLMSASSPDADPVEVFAALGFRDLSLIMPDGEVVGPAVPPDENLAAPRNLAAGSQSVPGGAAVYVPVASASGVLVIRGFAPDAALRENVGRSWAVLGGLAAALVGIAVAVANGLGRSMVEPVEDLSAAAARLGRGELDARVQPSGPPELERVGAEFNHLAGRVIELLQHERETAADLSHRLRTPLTAARLDAESLPQGDLRDRLLDDLAELERTVDHIITAARRPTGTAADRCDASAVVADRAAFWDALAEEQQRTSSLFIAAAGPLLCAVDADELAAAVDALIGNVFAHTPEGVAYRVVVEREGDGVTISVGDDGGGIRSNDVLERGRSGAGSTGLGLDIARRTAEAAAGSLSIGSTPEGGAVVTMRIPVASG